MRENQAREKLCPHLSGGAFLFTSKAQEQTKDATHTESAENRRGMAESRDCGGGRAFPIWGQRRKSHRPLWIKSSLVPLSSARTGLSHEARTHEVQSTGSMGLEGDTRAYISDLNLQRYKTTWNPSQGLIVPWYLVICHFHWFHYDERNR